MFDHKLSSSLGQRSSNHQPDSQSHSWNVVAHGNDFLEDEVDKYTTPKRKRSLSPVRLNFRSQLKLLSFLTLVPSRHLKS